ncbi:MAG: site-specific DNA-methyltransferase, partial [Candidatus Pacearchaeota archaeon]
ELEKFEKQKKYGIVWEDKPEQVALMCKEKLPILTEIKDKEIKTDKNKPTNILIEGDNYHALSVLNYTHKGKIDVIYIDPPYNTGNEGFMYNDKIVDKEDAYRHSKWLSFMEKRLRLARNLLSDKGVIFISIDDNEVAQLKLLCDEIFGEENFVDLIVWQKKSSPKGVPPKNMMVNVHEYIAVYQKTKFFSFNGQPRELRGFKNPDNDPRGPWRNTNIKSTTKNKNEAFTIIDPKTGNKFTDTWAYSKKELERLIRDNYIIFPKSNNGQVRKKEFFYEFKNQNIPLMSFWGVFDNQKNTEMLKDMFGDLVFLNPKPLNLIIFLLKSVSKPNSLILDFFAGSGTTGHAVLELNKEDGGNRKFILVTNNENNICTDVCYPRIEKVIKGYTNLKGEKVEGLGGNLKYFKTDFVDAKPTDKNKKKLVDESTEMLCLKEDCFDFVLKGHNFKIFKNNEDKYLGIIYDDDGIEPFKKEAKKLKKKFVVYVFSLDDSAREEEFEDLENVELKPIPAVILNVYKRIFRGI